MILLHIDEYKGGKGNNASQIRIEVNEDGTIAIPNKDTNLSISIDNGEHAEYFWNKRGGDAQIVEVEVPKGDTKYDETYICRKYCSSN